MKNKITKYGYMVIYSIQNGEGRICITGDRPISSYDNVEELDKFIKQKNGFSQLFVTDFKLLRTYTVK